MLTPLMRRMARSPRTRGAGMVLVGTIMLAAMAHSVNDWPAAFHQLVHASPGALTIALGLLMLAGVAAMHSWVEALPSIAANTRDWRRVFYVGQLGKYMPGSVWAAAIQAQLARRLGAQPRQLVSGFAVTFAVSILCSALVGTPAAYVRWGAAAVTLIAGASIAGLVILVALTQTSRATELTQIRLSPVNVTRSAAWSSVGWITAGLHLSVLTIGMGAPVGTALLIAPAASALAVCVGSLAVITPGGIGIRELVLMACLFSLVTPTQAAAAVILSRVLYLVADLLLAAISAISVPHSRKAIP